LDRRCTQRLQQRRLRRRRLLRNGIAVLFAQLAMLVQPTAHAASDGPQGLLDILVGEIPVRVKRTLLLLRGG